MKNEIKLAKIAAKADQHDSEASLRADSQRYGNTDYDSNTEQVYADALKWWQKISQKHFRMPDKKEYLDTRDLTTSKGLLHRFPIDNRPILSYAYQRLLSHYDLLQEQNLVHVLFKSQASKSVLASFEVQSVIPNYAQCSAPDCQLGLKVTPVTADPGNFGPIRDIRLSLAGWNEEQQVCSMAEAVKQFKASWRGTEMEGEIHQWQKELKSTNSTNCDNWNKLIGVLRSHREPRMESQAEVERIKEKLMWVTIMKYFEHGHSDKTEAMLQAIVESQKSLKPAKTAYPPSVKKFFETDCKICFCSFNSDSNQVLYCDDCNTSFHLACYGLQGIPKEDTYFCDCCKFRKNQTFRLTKKSDQRLTYSKYKSEPKPEPEVLIKKLSCQICNRFSFPLKQIDSHFYHVTCLVLLNLVRIRSGTLTLKEGLTHRKIQEMTVTNEISREGCQYCIGSSQAYIGYRLACASAKCSASLHPICAYIHGCKFIIRRDCGSGELQVDCFCNTHDQRDHVLQTYLRRYMCNFKATSNLNLEEFQAKYLQEQQKPTVKVYCVRSKIIQKTKHVRKILQLQFAKPNPGGEVETESRKMLEQLCRKPRH